MHCVHQMEALEESIAEKDSLLSAAKARLITLQADHSASGDAVSGLETLLADKDKQIER
jgi:RIM-binding protein of the cytomatrix active zone